MKKLKFYTTVGLLAASLTLTSCGSEAKREKMEAEAQTTEEVIEASRRVAENIENIVNEQLEREREEREAFEKAISNPEFIDTPEFASANKISITWNDVRDSFIVECSNETATYTISLPEERLISYMLKKCNCEYLYFHNLKDTAIIEELSTLQSIKEISIYDTKISNLDVLGKIVTLEGVRIENCPNITEVNFFTNLPNLTAVELIGTKVSDISPLEGATKLTSANLRCNEITNPEVLSDLSNLEVLRLEYNKIENISKLRAFIDKGILDEGTADSVVETSTNHALIFSYSDTGEATALILTYYEAQGEYYAEAKDDEGQTVYFLFTDEPYNFYDISKKLSAQKYLCLRNFPKEGYIHHLSNGDDFETVEVRNCTFDNFYMPDHVVYLIINNCPNLTGEFKAYGIPSFYSDLKYISIKNTGITTVSGLDLAHDLESVHLEDNKFDNYDFLSEVKNLRTATVTLDNPLMDTSSLEELAEKGVEVRLFSGVVPPAETIEKNGEEKKLVPTGPQK